MKTTRSLLLALTLLSSASAFADYVRIWRGYTKADLSRGEFVDNLNHSLFPATAALSKKSARLTNYLPVVLSNAAPASLLPDEVALLSYKDEASYRSYRGTEEGKHYGKLHWNIFDRQKSASLVPTPWQNKPEIESAYTVVSYAGDWAKGQSMFNLIARDAAESDDQFLERLTQRVKELRSTDPKGYYILISDDYAIEYILVENQVRIPMSQYSLESTQLRNDNKINGQSGGLVFPINDSTEKASVRATWQKHIDAWSARDLDKIISDYNAQSVVIHNDRIFRGPTEIRKFFRELFARFDEATDTQINRLTIENNVVYITWWAKFEDIEATVRGTDTFVIEDSVITSQTIAAFPW